MKLEMNAVKMHLSFVGDANECKGFITTLPTRRTLIKSDTIKGISKTIFCECLYQFIKAFFDMLQSLLQPRDNQRPKMIGAMPAVAVRHERRRNEKRGGGRRPSQLPLQLGRPGEGEPTPSPDHHRPLAEVVCSKLLALHFVVGTLLLGIVIMVVGVVQLSPGAEAAQHRYYLMGTGAVLMSAGVLGCVLRCIFLHWHKKYYREDHREPAHKNGVSTVEAGHDKHVADKHVADKHVADKHVAHDKHAPAHAQEKKLKSQASVGHAEVLIKQPSAASDT